MPTQVRTVLVVDDNAASRRTLELILESLGYKTATAPDGQAALYVLGKTAVDCIFMDLDMPILDGCSATEFIRNKLHLSSKMLPIIAITALPDQDLPTICRDFEMNSWVNKPVTKEQVRELLKAAGL